MDTGTDRAGRPEMTSVAVGRKPLKVAIVGSGPSGFYAAEALFRSGRECEVDMFERLPVPFGLVRSGVAPDHPRLKQPIEVYRRIAATPGFRFFGHVDIGRDITVESLRSHYHGVIVACGAESDRKLGIPGESLPGVHSARQFVGWYNGHPDFRDLVFDLSCETAVVFGHGNVAADVARILAKTPAELERTDIAAHALEVLAHSRIREIHVVGRRGPAQAKFTARELREFAALPYGVATVDPAELGLNAPSEAELADPANSAGRNLVELFREFARADGSCPKRRRVHFSFLKSPVAFAGDGKVESVSLEVNELAGEPFRQSARGTGCFVELGAGIAFCSVGYRGRPVPGLPFDEERGVIPHRGGRVLDGRGDPLPGIYVTGWIKRGPSGVIGTNRADSTETVKALLDDLADDGRAGGRPGCKDVAALLASRGIRPVGFADWEKIDRAEIVRGQAVHKPREKFTRVEEMLALLD